jgi:hypothetical protein
LNGIPELHVIETPGSAPPDVPPARPHVWRARVLLVIKVLFLTWMGVLLAVLPWTTIWTDNPLLLRSHALRVIAEAGFVRGLVSGLGLLDLWIAVADAVEYRE